MNAPVEGMVSTIIPVFNRPKQLREAVASVLAQDWRPIEVIIVDDGSDDGETPAVIAEFSAKAPEVVRSFWQTNAGPGAARETGRRAARGEFIQYLDSDDVLLPGKFAAQVAALRATPAANVAYGRTRFRHADGRVEPGAWKGSGTARPHMFPDFLNDRWWDTPTPLYRARICALAGAWQPWRLEEDWEYDCRVAAAGGTLVWMDTDVCEVRDHAGGRLSRGGALDRGRLEQRARAQLAIWSHAKRAGLPASAPDHVARFSRSLFLLARQCGAAGAAVAANRLLDAAREADAMIGRRRVDLAVYRAAASLVGARLPGRLSVWFDSWRAAA